MSVGTSIQVSVIHVALGVGLGSCIEALMPGVSDGASTSLQVFETLVQGGLNGAAIALVAGSLGSADPTYGIPFSFALYQAQPAFSERIELLSSQIGAQLGQAARKMQAPAAAA